LRTNSYADPNQDYKTNLNSLENPRSLLRSHTLGLGELYIFHMAARSFLHLQAKWDKPIGFLKAVKIKNNWHTSRGHGGRQTKDCSQTWSFGFQFRLGKHFSDERGLPFTTSKLGFLNISEYLAKYGIQMDPLVNERSWQSGKKPVLCMLGLLSTIIRGMERSDQESVAHEKIALAHEHNWAPITSTSAREVAHTSARRLGHPAWAGFF